MGPVISFKLVVVLVAFNCQPEILLEEINKCNWTDKQICRTWSHCLSIWLPHNTYSDTLTNTGQYCIVFGEMIGINNTKLISKTEWHIFPFSNLQKLKQVNIQSTQPQNCRESFSTSYHYHHYHFNVNCVSKLIARSQSKGLYLHWLHIT